MATACHRGDLPTIDHATRANRVLAVSIHALGNPVRHITDVQHLLRRHTNAAQRRSTVFHQRNVDGELAIARDELLRTVERIDQPITRPLLALRVVSEPGFLGNDRQPWPQRFKSCHQHMMRTHISFGERRIIGLGLHTKVLRIHGHDGGARIAHELHHRVEQLASLHRCRLHRYSFPSSRCCTRKSAAMARASVKSARSNNSFKRASGQGTTSISSGSSPGKRSS